MATTGHSPRQVLEEWDLPRVAAWQKFCEECPPLNLMVQAALGIKPASRPRPGESAADDLMATLHAFPGAAPKRESQ